MILSLLSHLSISPRKYLIYSIDRVLDIELELLGGTKVFLYLRHLRNLFHLDLQRYKDELVRLLREEQFPDHLILPSTIFAQSSD